jgi:hypothetical protein
MIKTYFYLSSISSQFFLLKRLCRIKIEIAANNMTISKPGVFCSLLVSPPTKELSEFSLLDAALQLYLKKLGGNR